MSNSVTQFLGAYLCYSWRQCRIPKRANSTCPVMVYKGMIIAIWKIFFFNKSKFTWKKISCVNSDKFGMTLCVYGSTDLFANPFLQWLCAELCASHLHMLSLHFTFLKVNNQNGGYLKLLQINLSDRETIPRPETFFHKGKVGKSCTSLHGPPTSSPAPLRHQLWFHRRDENHPIWEFPQLSATRSPEPTCTSLSASPLPSALRKSFFTRRQSLYQCPSQGAPLTNHLVSS